MKKPVTVFLLAVLLFTCASVLSAAWTTKQLTKNTGSSQMPAVAASGSYVYVVWEDYTLGAGEIYLCRSGDNGATWYAIKNISNNPATSLRPDIAASGANVYVVWQDATPGDPDIYFRRSADRGATWEAAKRITFTAGQSRNPAAAANGASVYVTWQDDTPGNHETYFRRSGDNGSTWNTVKRLTHNAGDSVSPAIAVDGAAVGLVWSDDTPGPYDAFFRRSANWGLGWEAAQKLSASSGQTESPAIAISGSDVYVAGENDYTGNDEIYFNISADNGSTWSSAQQLTNTSGTSGQPALAADGSDVYLTWHDSTPGNSEVYFRKSADNGSTWGATKRLTYSDAASGLTDVAVNTVNVYVVYTDLTGGDGEIFVKYSPR